MFSDILEEREFLSLLERLCPCFQGLHRLGRSEDLEWEIAKWGWVDFSGQSAVTQCQRENWEFANEVAEGRWRGALVDLFSDVRIGGGHLGWPEYYGA